MEEKNMKMCSLFIFVLPLKIFFFFKSNGFLYFFTSNPKTYKKLSEADKCPWFCPSVI